ncbi:MAG: hypothetical protein SPJ84_00435 [Fusobacterium gastrosuis]|uniref:hypothetical protein n=1 Tax=Fusobacterium gastrosuis TaxID=1755100 RepID=UPI002A9979FC|nr:hypothetical protein [Fusobacterium gastrosuis]
MFNLIKKFYKKKTVLLHYRVINDERNKEVHIIYYDENKFEEQLKYLKKNNYKTITFKDLYHLNKEERNEKI